jgi:hypothetical protein
MSTITVTYYPHDAGTRTVSFEKNNMDVPLTKCYEEGFGFETEVELRQGSLCYFDGLTNLEGRHGTKPLPLPFDGSAAAAAHTQRAPAGLCLLFVDARIATTGHHSTGFTL